jgi:hypothetical protein
MKLLRPKTMAVREVLVTVHGDKHVGFRYQSFLGSEHDSIERAEQWDELADNSRRGNSEEQAVG